MTTEVRQHRAERLAAGFPADLAHSRKTRPPGGEAARLCAGGAAKVTDIRGVRVPSVSAMPHRRRFDENLRGGDHSERNFFPLGDADFYRFSRFFAPSHGDVCAGLETGRFTNCANQKGQPSISQQQAMSAMGMTPTTPFGHHHFPTHGVQSYDMIVQQTPAWQTTCYVGNLTPYTTQNDLVPFSRTLATLLRLASRPIGFCICQDGHPRECSNGRSAS